MSWAVKNLIVGSSRIRSEGDFDSDEYMSLLLLEQKILELYDNKLLSEQELIIIVKVSNRYSYADISEELNINRNAIREKFCDVCQKIAYYLGDDYTDLGYVRYLKSKFNLSNREETELINFILKEE